MPFYYGFDMTYIVFVLPALLFALWAQIKVKRTFYKYSRVPSDRGMTGYDAAVMVLSKNGVNGVRVVKVSGELTDHYDPRENIIRLSDAVYDKATVAAVGVAAHEAGHAVQYATGYFPIKIRSAIIPMTNIGSTLAFPLVILGILFSYPPISYIGAILFGVTVVFQLVTLPVEFNASRRALASLKNSGEVSESGTAGAAKVLRAAALTYVAALATALGNFLRLLTIAKRSDRR